MVTPLQKESLVKAAKEALTSDYAVKNDGHYSAAVLTTKGNIYVGVSYFSDSYSVF